MQYVIGWNRRHELSIVKELEVIIMYDVDLYDARWSDSIISHVTSPSPDVQN